MLGKYETSWFDDFLLPSCPPRWRRGDTISHAIRAFLPEQILIVSHITNICGEGKIFFFFSKSLNAWLLRTRRGITTSKDSTNIYANLSFISRLSSPCGSKHTDLSVDSNCRLNSTVVHCWLLFTPVKSILNEMIWNSIPIKMPSLNHY